MGLLLKLLRRNVHRFLNLRRRQSFAQPRRHALESEIDARRCLESLVTQRMPRPGRITLTAMLNDAGRIVGEFTVARATEAPEFHVFDRCRRRSTTRDGSGAPPDGWASGSRCLGSV